MAVREFVEQLCRVSRMEISGYSGVAASTSAAEANTRRRFGAGIGVRSRIGESERGRAERDECTGNTTCNGDSLHSSLTSFASLVAGNQQPIIFSLQKLVEVAHYNLRRARGLFDVLGEHFTVTALHSNAAVSMYAVDGLRQLSLKFLEREELAGSEFQRR